MKEDRILNHSTLVCHNDDEHTRFPFYGYHVVVMKGETPDAIMLEIFDTGLGLTGSPPLYQCAISQNDSQGYPLIMFQMGNPGISKVELLDPENAHAMGFDRERATYEDGTSEFALSFTVDPRDGRVAPFIVPGRDLHKVRQFAPYANAKAIFMPMRDVPHHTDEGFGASFDGRMIRYLDQRAKRPPRIDQSCQHVLANLIVEHRIAAAEAERALAEGYLGRGRCTRPRFTVGDTEQRFVGNRNDTALTR